MDDEDSKQLLDVALQFLQACQSKLESSKSSSSASVTVTSDNITSSSNVTSISGSFSGPRRLLPASTITRPTGYIWTHLLISFKSATVCTQQTWTQFISGWCPDNGLWFTRSPSKSR